MLTPSPYFLLSNHRYPQLKYSGIIPLLRKNLADDGGALLPALVREAPWCWIPTGSEGWGWEEETDLPGRTMSVFYRTQKQLHQLDAVALCESGLGTQVWAHVVWYWSSMCVCFLRTCFPLRQYKSSVNFLNTCHHTIYLYTLADSFLNSVIPQVGLIFIFLKWRWWWDKWPKFLTS